MMFLGPDPLYPVITLTVLPNRPKPMLLFCISELPLPRLPPHPEVTNNNDATKTKPFQAMHQDSMTPPEQPKSSLKAGKFLPACSTTPPPPQAEVIIIDPDSDEDGNNPGTYSHTIDGIGDGTHSIIASFIKTNDKIWDSW